MNDPSLSRITCDAPLVQQIAKRICFAGDVTCGTCITNSLRIIEMVREHDRAERQEGRAV
jgi:hypothetical protein